MEKKDVIFPLAPVYQRKGIDFRQAKGVAIRPYGDADDPQGAVDIEYTLPEKAGTTERLRFDYLINATGPKLRFEATPGLGPDGHTVSVCTADHELREAGVRDLARVVYLTNEAALGDFGVDGMVFGQQGFQTTSELWTGSLFRERGVEAILGSHVFQIDEGVIHYETLDGSKHTLDFDFGMLIPPFGGQPLKAYDREGADITSTMFAPSGFMKVDADYTAKPYEEWRAEDWPSTYLAPGFDNIFAVGIAFAPPHQISKPRKTPNGTVIAPAPPRTGMPSGVMGKTAALTIADRLKHGSTFPARNASMARMGAACVASAGTGLTKGSAAAMTMLPVVPDYVRYPTGRDERETQGELGLHGHWVKLMLHFLFIYKAKALPGWQLIPE
jgi:sulfide:quinone oxidoreductase